MPLTAFALWACGGDDDPEVKDPSVATTVTAKYQISLSDDLLKIADVTAYYVSANGIVKSEPAATIS